jgi:hypothetical protein
MPASLGDTALNEIRQVPLWIAMSHELRKVTPSNV